jgi:hypothetical protein
MIALLPECAIFGKPLEVPGGMEQPVNWRSKPVREITPIPFFGVQKAGQPSWAKARICK